MANKMDELLSFPKSKNGYGQCHFSQEDVWQMSCYAARQKIPVVYMRELTKAKHIALLELTQIYAKAAGFLQSFDYDQDTDRRARNGDKINDYLGDLHLAKVITKIHFPNTTK